MRKSPSVVLSWEGRDFDELTPPPVSVEPIEGENDAVRIVHGDNTSVLRALQSELHGQVTLVYLDPPFFTRREFESVTRRRNGSNPPVRILTPAFDDRWCGLESYLSTLRSRLQMLREVVSPQGCVVVHVDSRTSHYVKVLGDEVFGPESFASEIIWRYRRWPARTHNFQRVHDVLLRWVRDPSQAPRFNQLYENLAPSTLKTWGEGKQRAVFDGSGRRRRSSTEPVASPGVPLGDVWEISIIAPVGRERTGYPTQKPEALLERLILSCTLPGDLVLDPYMGSGTSIAVAARLGRRALGIDQSPVAVTVTRDRLRAGAVNFSEYRASPVVRRAQAQGMSHRAP